MTDFERFGHTCPTCGEWCHLPCFAGQCWHCDQMTKVNVTTQRGGRTVRVEERKEQA